MPHDVSVPYTEEELENFKVRFRAMPTYGKDEKDEFVLVSDMRELMKIMDYVRTPEQIALADKFYVTNFGGKLHPGICFELVRNSHDTSKLAEIEVKQFDTDGDGFISEEEFKSITEVLCIHDEKLSKTTFEDFVAQADTNRDGKVSIDECSAWIKSQLSKPEQTV